MASISTPSTREIYAIDGVRKRYRTPRAHVQVVLEALERVALRGAVARAAPPHGVVRLGQRRRVVHERRERRADAEVADRRALAEARARVRARRRGALVGLACVGFASPLTPSTRHTFAIEKTTARRCV